MFVLQIHIFWTLSVSACFFLWSAREPERNKQRSETFIPWVNPWKDKHPRGADHPLQPSHLSDAFRPFKGLLFKNIKCIKKLKFWPTFRKCTLLQSRENILPISIRREPELIQKHSLSFISLQLLSAAALVIVCNQLYMIQLLCIDNLVNTDIFFILISLSLFVLNPQNTFSSVHKWNGADQTEFSSTLWWAFILWHRQRFGQIHTQTGVEVRTEAKTLSCFANTLKVQRDDRNFLSLRSARGPPGKKEKQKKKFCLCGCVYGSRCVCVKIGRYGLGEEGKGGVGVGPHLDSTSRVGGGDQLGTWTWHGAHTHTHYKGLAGRGARNAITEPKRHCSSHVSSPLLLSKYLEERSE